mmetsp:Transcript_6756/g.21285  ORF Transcript_6756/g.21285 Transcript_6756/m.21285 type:complete len:329 (-) Transcript_6756:4-990(-)
MRDESRAARRQEHDDALRRGREPVSGRRRRGYRRRRRAGRARRRRFDGRVRLDRSQPVLARPPPGPRGATRDAGRAGVDDRVRFGRTEPPRLSLDRRNRRRGLRIRDELPLRVRDAGFGRDARDLRDGAVRRVRRGGPGDARVRRSLAAPRRAEDVARSARALLDAVRGLRDARVVRRAAVARATRGAAARHYVCLILHDERESREDVAPGRPRDAGAGHLFRCLHRRHGRRRGVGRRVRADLRLPIDVLRLCDVVRGRDGCRVVDARGRPDRTQSRRPTRSGPGGRRLRRRRRADVLAAGVRRPWGLGDAGGRRPVRRERAVTLNLS